MPNRGASDEARWRWYGQVRDLLLLMVGIALVWYEAVSGHSDVPILVIAGGCMGIFTIGQVTRWFVGRNGNGK